MDGQRWWLGSKVSCFSHGITAGRKVSLCYYRNQFGCLCGVECKAGLDLLIHGESKKPC